MLVAQTGRKSCNDKSNQATGLILVLEGVLTVEQLEDALGEQFPWGGKWKVKAHGNKSFLVKFPSMTRLQELCGYPMFGLRGTKAVVKVKKWSPASNAIYKLYSVWVRISGIPASLLHRDGFAEAASMIGTLQDVDMDGYNTTEVIRVKCGVRDPSKIPEVGELTDDPFTYLIFFELEKVVEEGGRMVDGELVRQDGAQRDRMDIGGDDRTAKRTRNADFDKGEAGTSKNADEEMVPSSQPEIDREKEDELRQKMLKRAASSKQQRTEVNKDMFMEEIANSNVCYDDNGMLQKARGDCEESKGNNISTPTSMDDSDDDQESFARKAGLGTQAIKRINAEVDEEMRADELEEKDEQQNSESEQMKNKDSLVDETRRRTGRGNSEQNIVEKAKDRAKVRNLDGPAEDERATCKDKLNYVEQELAATKGRESALQERLLKELDGYQERYRDQVKKIGELDVQLNKEIDSRISAESVSASAKESIKELERTLQQLSENSEREKRALKKELSYMQDDSKLSLSKLNAELERMSLRAQNSEKEAKMLTEQLEDLKKQLDEHLREKNETEHRLLDSGPLPVQRSPTDDQKLIKLLQEELRNYESEVHEARRLKSSHTNVELLSENLLEEQGRRERAETEQSKLQEIEAKAHKLELELASCTSLLSNIPDVSSYSNIADLQRQALTDLNKFGEVTSRLKELEVKLEFAEISKQQAEGEATLAKERAESASREVMRLELLLTAVSEERDRLRKDHTNKKSRDGDDTSSKKVESDLSQMEKVVRELESSLHEQRTLISQQHAELNLMNEKLSMEARKAKSLEREGDQLRSQVALLESKLGHGDYSASSTKVLRMVNTLAVDSEAKQTIEALQAELKKTKERLQAIEELKGQADAGIVVDVNVAEKLAQLKNQVATLEKREERYKAVFFERISVFRKACCSLFGYQIVMNDEQQSNGIHVTRFTLQSVYAQNDDEKLEFVYESGSTNIVVNGYTSQHDIAEQVEIFIRKMNSIPAFTANLTMESFNKRSIC